MVFFFAASNSSVFAFSSGPPDGLTEAPGEGTCKNCHVGNDLNAAGGSLMLGVPRTYLPGEMYDIVVDLSRSGQSRWGFEMTALNGNGARAGTFTPANNGNTQVTAANSKQYIKQTTQGSASGTRDKNQWTFKWTAPTNDVGPITFYATGNAANGDFRTSGDYIYTQSNTSEVPVYGVMLAGVGSLTTQTTDASAAVTYTLKVTNTGNTNDTINLSTSGDASATLSPTTVPLDAGAARNVTLTVSGNVLTTAGDYEVKVKATSQGDSTKTAEVTTTTTVPPVYEVTLTGVSDLTTETTDASGGMKYTLRVTNTGNTSDKISLAVSGIAKATLNKTSVPLAAGASENVVLTIPGSSLATAGDYAAKVTATSQGDNAKTAEITTTTTILPVYGVTLQSEGELKGATMDMLAGVSYTLTVTNTGNTDDTVVLGSSTGFGIEGSVLGSFSQSDDQEPTTSQLEIMLAAGASAEVIFTAAGDFFTKPGEYEIKVTATSQGDTEKTAEVSTKTTILPVYGVTLQSEGELKGATMDMLAGVSYTLTVTNTGNTEDTVVLGSSTGFGIEGSVLGSFSQSDDQEPTTSQLEIMLAAGASAEVIFTAAGDFFTKPGEYEIKVTATSQGDSTKTAEVSTKTTILPVYGVTLQSEGELKGATMDMLAGVSYTLTVTNTGNTEDTVVLGSSAEFGIEGSVLGSFSQSDDQEPTTSQLEIMLAAGASAEVIFTAAGDFFTKPGEYEIKVTATSQGDTEKTAEVSTKTTILPVYGVTLQSEGELKGATMDMLAGVSYTLTVTNTGNTEDTVVLGSSAGFGIEGSVLGSFSQSDDQEPTTSQLEIMLAAGASAEVIFTAAGDFFTKPGEYEIKVTATSQGDSTKTAEVSTKTTILPVYGVTLAGVGELTTETSDASEGVSYMLTVTNTGNTDDVIDLTTSDDAAILSQTSVSLAAGASAEVTITTSGDDLATAGDYEVTVTATSQGDSTMSSVVTTTTTILPVYGVTLASIGDLMTETSDASEGVTYTLTITNTGNTDDVINLTSSNDAATLSQTSVSLAAGASAEVTITTSGDALATAGDYEVKITATSQVDKTKTAVISTNTTILPVYGVTLQSEGELKGATMDMLAGVSYTLTVTNTGNTEDTVVLGSSAEFGIEGSVLGSFSQSDDQEPTTSQLEIMLAAGASAEVIFTAAGDFFTKPGEYEIKVTATSQGDSTKTAEVSTKTTILPVYGVTLQSEGELKGATMDMLAGVSYTLTVTNTGNTEDTVVLGSSAGFGIEGSVLGSFSQSDDQEPTTSQLEIMLAAGASAEVIFTAAGDFFTKPGEYEIKVTATSQGDSTKTAEVSTKTTILPVYGVTLAGVGELTTETSDASEGVSYMLTVTNTGNTDDVIDLTTSGDAATLSQTSVSLAAGASAEVTITISGDDLATAGDYEVKVTATSQGDEEKTAEVSTTTTILPVYGVTLAGVDELTTKTSDASEGISYMLTATNTGNTDDVIDLTTSDDAAILSQTSVSLAAGASAEVTITTSGDDLATAGDYEVTVTATSQGDNTMSSEVSTNTKILPVYGVTLAGVGELTSKTSDASEGISYMLTATNTGNTDDVINLTSSNDAATLSQTSVSLAAGASAEVTITTSGDDLATAGDYEVTVTATSQGDSTMSSVVTTTTTILPVYGVTLASVGDLMTETSDASKGVTYTLTITNTGNTDDVINLTSSNDAATLSQASVSLAGGASTEVTITLSGDALATAGNYEVNVTATSQGDEEKTAEVTTQTTILPVYGVTLAGVDELTTKISDASEGISYMLTIANTGNTDDVVDLSTSGDATATLSETSVSLAAGASTEVTLTVSDAVLTTAGDYEVKVTATSQGDNTKTAAVSTTTTILPVHGVTLVGIGVLTTETSDAREGVSYMLTATNTGNTDDVIDLTSSNDAATLSQASVSLAGGASTEVTITLSGDALATAGNYEVNVTATSQGDEEKTAEVTTQTTILPIYGVTLAGVGELTSETTDASEGVSYMLTATNTGNTDDVIDLTSSDDAAILSQTSVSLAAGASAEVTITLSGDALATAGNYEVKITATSQVDKTKTAVISTNTTILPVYGVTLAGVDELTTKISDASEGISYMLTIANTGNTDDVVDLSTSGDATATLSETSVSLAAGASTEVTLTVSDAVLTTAGDYEVKVTATSQGDNTKTAAVSTTTTILPVHGVTLVGVGVLTTETSDAREGVSYTLKITNISNTDDVIDLTTSGDAATLSQTVVSLAAGASAEIILTISGDDLAIAGQYEVNVTATSQVDKTKTAVISTKTTILPVYGVTLQSEGELKGATMDMLAGVSYTLTVTNTGNTEDTVVLGSSAEFGIGGSVLGSFSESDDQEPTTSQLEIMLAAGASAEVIFTAAGDFFTKPGEYETKVTATSQGDSTKTAEVSTNTTILPVYGVTLTGEGELKGTTMDMLAGVSYTLTVTNTGNTDDTVVLGSSAEVGIGGSVLGSFSESADQEPTTNQLEIMLAAGASAEVIFTAAGDFFTKPGEYEIKVTATSQGDTEKTAEVSTKTTILPVFPVYGVTLQSEGELKGATMDMLAGVSYTLTVTNTGNTEDTVVLGSSAEFGIEGSVLGSFSQSADQEPTTSQLEIILAAGASAEVIFTAAGDFFTKPGEYEIKVTATSQGDSKKTAVISTNTTILPVYGVTLTGEGELTGTTMDMLAGVSYTLTVTNTGNTEDTVVLGSSAEFGIEGSVLGSFSQSDDQEPTTNQLEIMLAAGASAEVIFTAAGDFFTKPGEYEIKVTATSQGDSTKTAEVSTKTTILPVYGVTLQSEGELKGATMDMLAGVSYTLTVTNTGNTEDTVVLGSSAEVGIEGSVLGSFSESADQEPTTSQLEIMLAAGASAEVIFTAAGDFFTKPGEYETKVTATSQGDSTKTAELTTNTTIEPVPWDLNADGTVNILDLVAVANQFGESGEGLSGDVNMDGEVNILDLVQVASYFGKTHAEIVQANQ